MATEESRTFLLDKQLVEDLASSDFLVQTEAVDQLPEGLSREEVSDIGVQVSLLPGANALHEGRELEKKAIFHLGLTALIKKGDLVTNMSASSELRSRGDIVGWFMLANCSRRAKKQILKNIKNL